MVVPLLLRRRLVIIIKPSLIKELIFLYPDVFGILQLLKTSLTGFGLFTNLIKIFLLSSSASARKIFLERVLLSIVIHPNLFLDIFNLSTSLHADNTSNKYNNISSTIATQYFLITFRKDS